MSHWLEDGALRWRALRPFGAEVDRDLSRPLNADEADAFVRLVWDHGLVLSRGQTLTMDEQTALLAHLGPILRREGESGYISTEVESAATRAGLAFHADAAYTDHPFDALSLHAVDVVDGASSTRFVHAGHALDTLPDDLRARIAPCRQEMIAPAFETVGARSCDIREHNPMVRSEGASIHRNPHSGRDVLWLGEMHAARLLDMTWEDSRDLLNSVFDHLYADDRVYEHVWHRGDIVIWDNVALQHARGSLDAAGRRVLQRVIVGIAGVAPHVAQQGAAQAAM